MDQIVFTQDTERLIDNEPPADGTVPSFEEYARGLLVRAIRAGVDDIHIERFQAYTRIRGRANGVLEPLGQVPHAAADKVIAAYKELSGIGGTDKRTPSQGNMQITVGATSYNVRALTCPTFFGEKLVLRISDRSTQRLRLDQLGLWDDDRASLAAIAGLQTGLVCFVGHTGAGKSTTEYALLSVMAAAGRKAVTVEDCIAADLPGVTQIEINRKAGMTFANALRDSTLADADVLYVTYPRDLEALQLLFQAASSGHLLLTDLRVRSSAMAPRRFHDVGIDYADIASVLRIVVAQTLVRKICPVCSEPLSQEEVDAYGPIQADSTAGGYDTPRDAVLYRGRGCESCHGRGYKGRTGLFEIMQVTPTILEAIRGGAFAEEIEQMAVANGMKTLWADGMRKAVAGVTTVDEVNRMVYRASR